MTYSLGAFGTEKWTIFLGAVWMGIIVCFLIGAPLLLILRNSDQVIPIWLGVIFVIIVFPIVAFWCYKVGQNRMKKEK